jgi:hypothetical protein
VRRKWSSSTDEHICCTISHVHLGYSVVIMRSVTIFSRSIIQQQRLAYSLNTFLSKGILRKNRSFPEKDQWRQARARATDPEPKIWAASPVENTPWEPNQAVRSIPGGHGMEGLPPSRSLHGVMASLWSPRVQVTPSRVLHGSEPWALTGGRRGSHGRPRAGSSPNWDLRTAGAASGARGCPLNRVP